MISISWEKKSAWSHSSIVFQIVENIMGFCFVLFGQCKACFGVE